MESSMRRTVRKIVYLLGAVLALMAERGTYESNGSCLILSWNGWGIESFFFVLILAYAIDQIEHRVSLSLREKNGRSGFLALAVLLSLLLLMGKMFAVHGSLKPLFCADGFLYGAVNLIGAAFVIYPLLLFAVWGFGKLKYRERTGGLNRLLFDSHPVLGTMALMMLVRIPYYIAFYPCTLSWDGLYMLDEWLGLSAYTDHYPPLITALYGSLWGLGTRIGSRYLILFLFVLLQSLLTAWAVGLLMAILKKMKIPYAVRWGVLAFFVLFTIWNIYSITLVIDSLYWPVTVLYTVQLIAFVLDSAWFNKISHVLLLSLTAVLLALIRNNGIFVFLLTIPFLFFMVQKRTKLYIAASVVMVSIAMLLMSKVVYPALGVVPSFKYDTFCVCYQQTARFLTAHEDELPQEEREFLEQAMDIDAVIEFYTPYTADQTKWRMNWGFVSGHLKEYLALWARQGLRDPFCYIQSFLNSSMGYYYPNQMEYEEGLGWYGPHPYDVRTEGYVEIDYADKTQRLRELLTKLPYSLRQIPGIGMLYSCGFYSWIVLPIALILFIKKQYRLILALLPGVINILVCFVSPINPHVRYTLPTMAAAAVSVCLLWYGMNKAAEEKKSDAQGEVWQ